MARFDVFPNPGTHANTTPYLLGVQSDFLDGLDGRAVIPLRSLDHFAPVKLSTQLTPVLNILGQDCLLETPKMGAVPQRILKGCVASLKHDQARISGGLDFLFHGY